MDGFLAQVDARQLGRWQAFARLEPFGFGWQREQAGVLASTIATFSQRSKKADWAVADFFRWPADGLVPAEVPPAAPASLKERLKAAFSMFPQKTRKPER